MPSAHGGRANADGCCLPMSTGRRPAVATRNQREEFQMLARLLQALGIAVVAISAGGLLFFHTSGSHGSPLVPIAMSAARAPQTAMPYTIAATAAARVEVPTNIETPAAEQIGARLFRE